jgi:hypothetical protein
MKLHPKCPLQSHALADELPMLEGERKSEFQQLIKQNREKGIAIDPIVIIRKGADIGYGRTHDGDDVILLGRNRVVAELENGTEWDKIAKRDYSLKKDGTPENAVFTDDIGGRRHLTDAARAILAAKFVGKINELEEASKPKDEPAKVDHGKDHSGGVATGEKASGERPSHKNRKEAAKKAGVSEDAVKKAQAISKFPELEKQVKANKLSLDAAAKQASELRNAEQAQAKAKKIAQQRKDALMLLKTNFGTDNPFVKRVVSGKIFGNPQEDARGHKEFLLFNELTLSQQRHLMPLLFDGHSLKKAQAIQLLKITPASVKTMTASELEDHAVSNGLGVDGKTESKKYETDNSVIEVKLNAERKKEVAAITSKSK